MKFAVFFLPLNATAPFNSQQLANDSGDPNRIVGYKKSRRYDGTYRIVQTLPPEARHVSNGLLQLRRGARDRVRGYQGTRAKPRFHSRAALAVNNPELEANPKRMERKTKDGGNIKVAHDITLFNKS